MNIRILSSAVITEQTTPKIKKTTRACGRTLFKVAEKTTDFFTSAGTRPKFRTSMNAVVVHYRMVKTRNRLLTTAAAIQGSPYRVVNRPAAAAAGCGGLRISFFRHVPASIFSPEKRQRSPPSKIDNVAAMRT